MMVVHRVRYSFLAVSLLAVFAVALSGCAWRGEGKQVATAIEASSKVKSRAFKGSVTFDMSQLASGSSTAQQPKSMSMAFDGAIDTSDPAHPKMRMNMSAQGEATSIVAPGDGKVYLTARGSSYSTDVPPERAASSTIDPQKIYAALGGAVTDFQKSQPITNAEGNPVATTSAKVSRSKLCGPVLEAFGDALGKSAGLTGGLGGGLAGGRGGGGEMFAGICKAMLKSDPRIWFGVAGGVLTDVELTATINIPFGGPMAIEVQYHEYNQDKPQSGFDPPAGATPLSSFDALPGAAANSGISPNTMTQ